MIGKTNVNERNTAYRTGELEVHTVDPHVYSPSDYGLDYFDRVNVTSESTNPIIEMCNGHSFDFTPETVGEGRITDVLDYLFYRNSMLRNVIITSSFTRIGTYAFGMAGMRTLYVDGRNITSLGQSAFTGNKQLTTAYCNLPRQSDTLSLFQNSTNLTQMELSGIVKMGEYFLFGAPKLPYLEIPSTTAQINDYAFDLNRTDMSVEVDFHMVFLRHAEPNGSGGYEVAPTTLRPYMISNRTVAKLNMHVPLDSLLAYRVQVITAPASGLRQYMDRVFAYRDCAVGDTLPTSLTQTASGYEGTYTLTWYKDYAHTMRAPATVSEAGRYYATLSNVSETAI